MANTVIGVYDTYNQAQQARNELMSKGFSIENVKLSPELETAEARKAALRHDNQGGIRGFFHALFGTSEHERHADIYSEAVRRGSYLLTVHAETDDQVELATEIINRYNPIDINERFAHWQSQGWSQYDMSAPVLSDSEIQQERTRYATETGKTVIPVIQEELQVGKRVVQRGGVHIFQHVVETPVQESVQLREEHVSVERHAVNEPATETDMANLKEGSFEVRESAEEAVVAKTARVVEEVRVGKDVSERTETIKDTVRRTDVEIEQMAGGAQSTSDDTDFRSHWQTTYGKGGGRYEDYASAYRFGARVAHDDRYSKYRWNEVEPDVQRDWESSNVGHPWGQVKDAVRYGWERITK